MERKEANTIYEMALSSARNAALRNRKWRAGWNNAAFDRGFYEGRVLHAWIDADPLVRMACNNEARFLLGSYLERSGKA
jgi:hypothetical protein